MKGAGVIFCALSILFLQQGDVLAQTELDEDTRKTLALIKILDDDYLAPSNNLVGEKKGEQALKLLKRAQQKLDEAKFQNQDSITSVKQMHLTVLERMVQVYVSLGEYSLAGKTQLELYEQSKETYGKGQPYYLCTAGEKFIEAKDYSSAEAAYERALSELGELEWVGAQKGLWITYIKQGKLDKVKDDIAKATERVKTLNNPQLSRTFRVCLKQIYQLIDDKTSLAKVVAILDDRHCPICGSDHNVQPIVYGLPASPMPDVQHGGCMITADSLRWYCKTDKVRF